MDSGHQPNGTNPGHQQNGVISNASHAPNGTNPGHQQNGIISNASHTPNGTSSQHESTSQGQAPMPLQQAPMEHDYPITAIRVPVSTNERPHYVPLEIRDCGCRRGCTCRYPDLQEFLGEHEIWDIDYQMFQAHWEPAGMESLNGIYILFTKKTLTPDRLNQRWNQHFLARLKGDVFILKVKESMDERSLSTAQRLRPRYRTFDAHYEHIPHCFFGSDLFTEMTMAATHPYTRVCNPALAGIPILLGKTRAPFRERVLSTNYQNRTPKDRIMARFWPLPRRG
ncbi:hypothetical protein JMJ35_008499 [Cladonia borealis]|uniref:Uncharacterized protein n=1 Tax=Cladonia borealis TaxID=184061 RepID=A0AA39UYS3_9LECA|nr:hypothetical protein JMJ35_008499 [Cladonia borealis]